MHPDLIDLVRNVADARANLQTEIDEKNVFEEAFKKALAPYVDKIKRAQARLIDAEVELRSAALKEFEATGNKKPVAGVEVKLFEELHFDHDVALAWAREHNIALLPERLDVKTFEKVAKTTKPDFVTVVERPQVTLAKDLDKALAEAEVDAIADGKF